MRMGVESLFGHPTFVLCAIKGRYPTDGQVQVFMLLDGMSDERNLTIQQLHEYDGLSAKKPQ